MKEICIKVNNLEVNIVRGISFEVERGIIFGLLGPKGAGKSTVIKTMIGLLSPAAGQINILGVDPKKNKDKLQEKIGVQLQSPDLFDKLTVKELISLFASYYKNPLSIEKSIEIVNLQTKKNHYIETLSKEEKTKLTIALAILDNKKIIFLNEPTKDLGFQSKKNIWAIIEDLKKSGKTIFITTQYGDEAEELCDQLLIIDQGIEIIQGKPSELIKKHFEEEKIEFKNPAFTEEEIGFLVSLDSVVAQKLENNETILLYTMDAIKTISSLFIFLEKIKKPIKNLNLRRPTLEDLFVKLTGNEIRD